MKLTNTEGSGDRGTMTLDDLREMVATAGRMGIDGCATVAAVVGWRGARVRALTIDGPQTRRPDDAPRPAPADTSWLQSEER